MHLNLEIILYLLLIKFLFINFTLSLLLSVINFKSEQKFYRKKINTININIIRIPYLHNSNWITP